MVNIILVSSTYKVGLDFPLRALINHLHKEENIKDLKLILENTMFYNSPV
jgi:hypothetical protein